MVTGFLSVPVTVSVRSSFLSVLVTVSVLLVFCRYWLLDIKTGKENHIRVLRRGDPYPPPPPQPTTYAHTQTEKPLFYCAKGRFPTGSFGRSFFLSGLSVYLTLLTGTLIHHLRSLSPLKLVQCQQEKMLLQILISLFMKSVALYKKYGARRKKEKQLESSEISLQRFSKPFPNK